MGELWKDKVFWLATLVCFCTAVFGILFSVPEFPLPAGSFLKLYEASLRSQTVLFLLPIISVLPAGASYVKERSGGFLKMYITRISRMDYIKRKTFLVYGGGFFPFFLAGGAALILSFLIFYPMELKAAILWEEVWGSCRLLFRVCLTGGLMAEISGFFAAVFCNYYMAYGLPFVCYYLLIILKERYLPGMYAMYPAEWILAQEKWGTGGNGIWMFFLLFTAAAFLLHGLALYGRLREI